MKSFKFRLSFLLPIFLVLFSLNLYAGPKEASILDATVTEGNSGATTLSFVIEATDNVTDSYTVDYVISDGTAEIDDSDYSVSQASGTVNFVGTTNKATINVTINGDLKIEIDETISVEISNPQGGNALTSIDDDVAVGTITNDDNIPATLSSPENTTDVTTILGQGNFSIIGGADSTKLSITNAGVLTFNTSPDWEHPTDADSNNIYEVEVELEFDTGGTVTQVIQVTVTDMPSDLAITMTASADPVLMGTDYSYNISVINNGSDTSENITVINTLPAGVAYNGYLATDWVCNYATGILTCDYPSNLTANASTPDIRIDVIAPSTGTDITNSAVILADTSDDNTVNNRVDKTISLTSNASNLTMIMTANPSSVLATGEITYTYSVENKGPNDVTGIEFTNNLPNNLNFISLTVENPNEWSCSTGSSIVCNYRANFTTLNNGDTSGTVTVLTRAPNESGTVESNSTVISDVSDTDQSDNTVSTSVTVGSGTDFQGEEAFRKYLQFNVFGDLEMLTSANLNYSGTYNNYNDNVNMQYINTDTSGAPSGVSIYNSSSRTLSLNSSYEIVWAGLYWQGRVRGSGTYGSFDDGINKMDEVLLKLPGDTDYQTITANKLNHESGGTDNEVYGGFADITNLVNTSASNANGSYSVANIVCDTGTGDGGQYGGWTILTIYKDPNADVNNVKFKNVSVFNGFVYVNTPATPDPVVIDGFVTPDLGSISSKIAYFAGDGDGADGGSAEAQYFNVGAFENVYGNTNLLNSVSSTLGVNAARTYGIEGDVVNVSKYIDNEQTSATFRFDAGTNSVKDYYTLNMFAFSTDMYTPLIHNMDKSATVNGNAIDSNTTIHIHDVLTYNIHFNNNGTGETAHEVEIFDDFDQDNLSDVFDISNFDVTTIYLSAKNDNTTWFNALSGWEAGTECGYDNVQHKVWCKIDEILDGDSYDMKFDVTVIAAPADDSNVTNTALSIYKNATTGSYVEIVNIDNEWYGGSSNSYNAGEVGDGATPPEITSAGVDVADIYSGSGVSYASSIYTKVSTASYSLKSIYLGGDATPKPYPGNNQSASLTILYKLADMSNGATCDSATTVSTSGVAIIDPGETEQISNVFPMTWPSNLAKKDVRIKYKAVDFNQIIDASSVTCAQRSSTGGVVEGIPACLITNAPDTSQAGLNYKTIFGEDAFNNCYNANGQPCYASSGGVGNPPYDSIYGCFECSIGNMPYTCSDDNFAIRPNEFEISSTDATALAHWPKLLRSGHEYPLTLKALDASSVQTQGYNQTKANLLLSDSNVTAADLSNTVMNGTLAFAADNFNMTNGISEYGGANNVVKVSFDDVANVNLKVVDKNWTAVDFGDGTSEDCSGRWICGDEDFRFIVDHFDINETNLTNVGGTDGNFTYVSNLVPGTEATYAMSARVQVTVSAKNESGDVTQNFQSGNAFYENNVSLSIVAPAAAHGNAVVMPDTTVPLVEIPHGFTNGIKTVAFDELDTNASKALFFNYPRTVNNPLNPFRVNAANVAVNAASTYTQIPPAGADTTANITGNIAAVEDGNATFIYGRTHASRQRYTGPTGTPNIYFESFCFGTDTNGVACDPVLLNNFSPNKRRTDDVRWFINEEHTVLNGGSIGTVVEKDSLTNVTVTNPVDGNPSNVDLTYGGTDYPYKTTMENNASRWLIYDPDDATGNTTTINSFPVEFMDSTTGWSGKHETDVTTKTKGKVNSNRRSMW